MYCQSTTLVKYEQDARQATALRCRSWNCPDCVDTRRRQLMADVMKGAPTVFLTLTIKHVEGETADGACKRLVDAWRRARRSWCKRQSIKKLPFFAVVEATKAGWPHLHVMLRNTWIDQKWLSAFMLDAIASPIVDIRKIDNAGRAAGYVAKYTGKAAHKFGTAKRYWCSQDYKVRADKEKPEQKKQHTGVERWPESLAKVVHGWHQLGWRVTWLTRWRARAIVGSADG
jgi:hypothetical protein